MTEVWVTGLGVVSAIGVGVSAFRESLLEGRCGIQPLELGCGDLTIETVAAPVAEADIDIDAASLRRLDRTAIFAVHAAEQASEQAGLESADVASHRCGVVVGTAIGGWGALQDSFDIVLRSPSVRVSPFAIPRIMVNSAASWISIRLGLEGPSYAVSSACASGNHAIANGVAMIRAGLLDVCLAGGAEAGLTYSAMKVWSAMRILSTDTCRPFSLNRTGLVVGEGAGILVLESAEHAKKRGVQCLAKICGIGMSADAGDLVQPSRSGVVRAIKSAIADASLHCNEIDYINAHGTGTRSNDAVEANAIRQVFGETTADLSVSSTKSMHGHCLGAAGGIEAVATVLALQRGFVPPTVNHLGTDPDCPVNVTANIGLNKDLRAALSSNFAFGGLNAVVAFRRS